MKTKNFQNAEESNPVYFGVGYYEALESKKDILSSEMSFLNLIKIIRRYNSLKMEELIVKERMYKAIKELNGLMKKTKASFPFLKIPEKAKREEVIKKEITLPEERFDEDLENQLRDIQEKLKSISNY